jgi:hypothetical protein
MEANQKEEEEEKKKNIVILRVVFFPRLFTARSARLHISMPDRWLWVDRGPRAAIVFISCICKGILAV